MLDERASATRFTSLIPCALELKKLKNLTTEGTADHIGTRGILKTNAHRAKILGRDRSFMTFVLLIVRPHTSFFS
jgi:hypothetical protein